LALLPSLLTLLGAGEAVALTDGSESADVSAAEQASWRNVTAHAERFSAQFPARPEFRSVTQHTIVGDVTQTGYRARFGDGFFSVELHELPGIAEFFAPANLVLERAKNQILKESDTVPLSFARVETEGHPGSVFSYRSDKSNFEIEEVRLVLVGKRLFKLTAGLVKGSDDRSAMDRFFNSFRFWK